MDLLGKGSPNQLFNNVSLASRPNFVLRRATEQKKGPYFHTRGAKTLLSNTMRNRISRGNSRISTHDQDFKMYNNTVQRK